MRRALICVMAAAIALWATGDRRTMAAEHPPVHMNADITAANKLELHAVKEELVTYKGKRAVQLSDDAAGAGDDTSRIAIVHGVNLKDGVIDVRLTGDTLPNAAPDLRGFVGIAFRVSDDSSRYECIYLRPKNGRAADPVQRSHATQYISVPGYPWQKLRTETPGRYEFYVDIGPGEWTDVKIEFADKEARLYVNGAAQPTLVVHDLKQPVAAGGVALWVGPGTLAHFADLRVTVP